MQPRSNPRPRQEAARDIVPLWEVGVVFAIACTVGVLLAKPLALALLQAVGK